MLSHDGERNKGSLTRSLFLSLSLSLSLSDICGSFLCFFYVQYDCKFFSEILLKQWRIIYIGKKEIVGILVQNSGEYRRFVWKIAVGNELP